MTARASAETGDLTKQEEIHCRTALRHLHTRTRTWSPLATALHVKVTTLSAVAMGSKPVSASLAFRVARFARVSVDDVLTGKFPDPKACPHCGHVAEEEAATDGRLA